MNFIKARRQVADFLRDETGLAAVEYAIMAIVLVGIISVAVEGPLNTAVTNAFTAIGTAVTAATS